MTGPRRDRFVRLRQRARLGAAAAFLLAGVIIVAAGLPDQRWLLSTVNQSEGGIPVAPVVGARAPSFTAEDVSGSVVDLHALRGQVVVLNFWATWCGPCQVEIVDLQTVYSSSEPGSVAVLGFNVDEPPTVFVPWAHERGVTFRLLSDIGQIVQRLYHVRGTPQTVVIDSSGMVREIFYGPVSLQRLRQTLDRLEQ